MQRETEADKENGRQQTIQNKNTRKKTEEEMVIKQPDGRDVELRNRRMVIKTNRIMSKQTEW